MSDPQATGVVLGLMALFAIAAAMTYSGMRAEFKYIDVKSQLDEAMLYFELWKATREKPLTSIEMKYMTDDEKDRESVLAKERHDRHFIADMEALRKQISAH
nr:MAG TPA: hypothetical protein [Bacteriophage sp.]